MLQIIRDGSKGWITWVIVGLISITFIAIGTGNYWSSEGANEVVAKIEGKKITKGEVEKLMKRMMNQNPAAFEQNPDLTKLRQEALKALTDNAVLVNAAVKRGFVVSPQQVVDFLNTVPDFQDNGRFSNEKYKNILARIDYTDAEFRQEIHNMLLIDQLRQAFRQTAFIIPEEVSRALQFEHQKRDFDFIIIPNSLFEKEVHASEADILAYYNTHLNQYMTDEKVKVEYLLLSKNAQESEEAFAKKADEFIKLTYDQNESLAPAADKLELTIQKSGDLLKTNNTQAAPFNNPKVITAAFSEEVLGQMNSDVIQLEENQYIVLRLLEHHKPKQKALAEVQSDIQKRLIAQGAAKKAEAFSLQWLAAIKKGENYKAWEPAKSYHLKWESAKDVSRATASMPMKIMDEAFRLPKPVSDKALAKHTVINDAYQGIIVLHKVKNDPLNTQALDQKKHLETQLGHYVAQLEFDLFTKAALKEAAISKI